MSFDFRPDDDFMGAERSDEFTGPYFEISSDVKSKGGFLNEGSPYAYFGSKENHYNDKVVRFCNEESGRLESMDLEHRATFDTLEMVPKNKAAYAHFNSKENKYNGSVEGTSCWESVDLKHRVTTFETIVMVPENKGTYAYVNLKENKYNGSKEGRCCWESMDHWATLAMVSENKGAYVHFNSKENKYNGTKEGSCFWRSTDLNHRTTFQTLAMVKKSKGSCAYVKLKENKYNGSKEVTSCWESTDVDSGTCAYLKLKENKYNGSKEVTCCWESMDVDHRVTTVKTLVIVPGKKGTYVHFKLKENKINGTKEGSCCWESVDLEHRATTLETLAMIPESMGTYAYFNSKESKYNGSPALRRECITKSILGLEDLQQHFGGRRDAAAKSFGAIYDPGIHTTDALARKSFKVVETLQTEEQPNDCVPILSSGTLAVEGCVQEEKSPNLPRVMQISRVEQRVRKLPTYLGGLTAQSASSSHWPIGLPDGRHIVLLDPLEQSTKNGAHGARADKCSPSVSVPETKKVRKTWKRKCRTMNVVFEIQQQSFGRRCEGAAKKFRVTHICRKHGIKQVSAVKRYHNQHSIHQWPFHQKWATRKGYSLGDERPFEVSSLSVDEKLDSRLQFNHMCQFARSSPRPLALPNGGEIIGPIALSSSEFSAANKRAHLVGQDQSNSTATHHEMKVTREISDKKGLSKHKVAMRRLGVNVSMFKSTCRQNRAYWWPCQIENNQQQSFHATNNRAHLVKAEMKNKREALKGECITNNVYSLEDLEHYGGRHKDAAKGLGDSLARKSFEVLDVLPLLERSYSIRHLVPQRILAPKRWVRLKKSQDLPRTQQMNCSGGLTAIELPEGGHILSLSEMKIVRKTLKRKCRSMNVLSLEDHKQHVDRRWEDVTKSHGVKRICRQLVIHCLSTAKRIRKQHGIHRWPFQRSAIGLPDGGHILPLSEKKIVRKTLKRKCRSMSVISLVDRQQHVDKRCEDVAKNIGVHAAKRICRQLVIHHVSKAKHRQHVIHHQWPFHQDWATMKGYSLGDERPVEVISLSTHVKLVSRLQLIYISWLGRFSPWPLALAGGGEIGGPIALSLSESAATKNIAQRVGQDQSGSAASDSKNEITREQEDPEEICTSVTSDDLRRLSGRMNRKDAAASLGVSESTFKRKCREYGIKRWPHVRKDKVGRPPDQHGEGNTSTARKTPSHNVQTGMEGEPVGQNHEANVIRVFRRDCMRGPIAWNTESRLITVSIPPDQHGERNTSTACETPSHNVETGMEVEPVGQNQEANVFRRDFTEGPTALNTENGLLIGSSSEWASQVKDQSTLSTPYPNHDALAFPQPQTTSMLSENWGGSIDCRSSLVSQAEPFSDRHISGSVWRSPDQLEGQTTQFTAHPNPNALVFPQSQIASTQVLNENEDGRNSLQLEAYFMGHVSESSNLAFPAYSDAAAPSQPVATILQAMPMTTHMIPQTGDLSVIFQLEGQLMQSTSHPNLNVVPPEPRIGSTQMLSENMGSQENWEFLSLGEEPPLGGHVSGSVNVTVTTCDPSPSQQPMPTNRDIMPTARVMSHLIAREDMTSVTLKVSYGHKTIKFQVPLTSRIIELKEEVKKRLKLEPSSFDFEYKDEDDGDWIFLGCDEDLTNHLQLFSNQVIRLLVVDSDASTKDICESCGSLKRKRQ